MAVTALAGLSGSVNVNTTSSTTLTIGSGQQSLTVGTGLNILATQPVKLTASGGTMFGTVTSYIPATGAMIIQVGMYFTFEIRSIKQGGMQGTGYVSWYDFGVLNDYGPLLTATLGNGISILDTGIIQIQILETQFRQLHHHTYLASLTMFDGYSTRQVFCGRLPVLYGGVST